MLIIIQRYTKQKDPDRRESLLIRCVAITIQGVSTRFTPFKSFSNHVYCRDPLDLQSCSELSTTTCTPPSLNEYQKTPLPLPFGVVHYRNGACQYKFNSKVRPREGTDGVHRPPVMESQYTPSVSSSFTKLAFRTVPSNRAAVGTPHSPWLSSAMFPHGSGLFPSCGCL